MDLRRVAGLFIVFTLTAHIANGGNPAAVVAFSADCAYSLAKSVGLCALKILGSTYAESEHASLQKVLGGTLLAGMAAGIYHYKKDFSKILSLASHKLFPNSQISTVSEESEVDTPDINSLGNDLKRKTTEILRLFGQFSTINNSDLPLLQAGVSATKEAAMTSITTAFQKALEILNNTKKEVEDSISALSSTQNSSRSV